MCKVIVVAVVLSVLVVFPAWGGNNADWDEAVDATETHNVDAGQLGTTEEPAPEPVDDGVMVTETPQDPPGPDGDPGPREEDEEPEPKVPAPNPNAGKNQSSAPARPPISATDTTRSSASEIKHNEKLDPHAAAGTAMRYLLGDGDQDSPGDRVDYWQTERMDKIRRIMREHGIGNILLGANPEAREEYLAGLKKSDGVVGRMERMEILIYSQLTPEQKEAWDRGEAVRFAPAQTTSPASQTPGPGPSADNIGGGLDWEGAITVAKWIGIVAISLILLWLVWTFVVVAVNELRDPDDDTPDPVPPNPGNDTPNIDINDI